MTNVQPARTALALRSQETGQTYSLSGEVLVGREVECDIQLKSIQVSRYHAKLTVATTGLYVEDLESSNGTFVNGKLVRERTELGLGDQVAFDDVVFRVTSLHSGSADTTLVLPSVNVTDRAQQLRPDIDALVKQKRQPNESPKTIRRGDNGSSAHAHGMTVARSNVSGQQYANLHRYEVSGQMRVPRRKSSSEALCNGSAEHSVDQQPGSAQQNLPAKSFPVVNVMIGVLVLLLIIVIILT